MIYINNPWRNFDIIGPPLLMLAMPSVQEVQISDFFEFDTEKWLSVKIPKVN